MVDKDSLGSIRITCSGADVAPLDSLVPFQGDLKTLSAENLDKLKRSILKYGFTAPCFVWKHDGILSVLDAHQRITALKSLRDDGYVIPLLPVDYIEATGEKEAKEKLLHITSQYGEFSAEGLREFTAELKLDVIDTFRLTEKEFKLIEPIEESIADNGIPNEVKTVTAAGDLLELGRHRLICGDSTDADIVARLMKGERAQICFTDPPYGVSIGDKNKFLNSFQKAGMNLRDIEHDNESPEVLKETLVKVFTIARTNVAADDCTFFVTAPQGGELGMMMMMMHDSGLPVRHVLMWYKNAPTFSMGRLDYDYQHEPILLTWGKKHKRPMGGEHRSSVWKIDKPRTSAEHPTMKPVELYENAYLNNSDNNDNAYEPFAGSGTAFIAGERTGRRVFGIELDPHYCDVIVARYQEWCKANQRECVIKRNGEILPEKQEINR